MFQCPAPIINLPPAPENHDWLKMIVSAALGFIAAICLEPIKNKIQRRHSAKLAKRMIKSDLVRLLERAYHYERQDMERDNFWPSADIPAYSHFKSASPNLFYEEKDMHLFGGKCERLHNAIRTGQTQPYSADLDLFRRNLEAVIDDDGLLAEAKRISEEN